MAGALYAVTTEWRITQLADFTGQPLQEKGKTIVNARHYSDLLLLRGAFWVPNSYRSF